MIIFPFYLVPVNGSKLEYGISECPNNQAIKLQYIKDNFWGLLNQGMINSCCNHIYKRRGIVDLKLRFRMDMNFSEDGLFNVTYLRALTDESNIYYLSHPLYNYVANDEQCTKKKIANYFYQINLAWDNIDLFIGKENRNDIYWRGWLSNIKQALYHQGFKKEDGEVILENNRTKDMIKNYRPRDCSSRILFNEVKRGNFSRICWYYRTKSTIRGWIKMIIKGRIR